MAWSDAARAAAKEARQRNRKDNRGDEFRNATARRLKRMRSAMKGVKRPGTVRERNAFIRAGAGNLDVGTPGKRTQFSAKVKAAAAVKRAAKPTASQLWSRLGIIGQHGPKKR